MESVLNILIMNNHSCQKNYLDFIYKKDTDVLFIMTLVTEMHDNETRYERLF